MGKNRFIVDFLFGAKKSNSFGKTIDSINKKISSVGKTAAGVAAGVVSFKAFKDFSTQALDSASGLEGYRSTLNVVMKDQVKAAKTMAWAVDFANRTPFETDSVVEATVRLESYGIKAQDVMTKVGDMAGVMNKDLMQAVEAVADAQTGSLERLKEFGITKEMIGAKAAAMYKNQTIINNKGQIVEQEKFNNALFALMEDRFKGGMEIQSKSYKGLMSTISGVWKTGLANIAGISATGEIVSGGLFDTVKDGLSWTADKLQEMSAAGTFEKAGQKVGKFVNLGVKYGKKALALLKKIKDFSKETLGGILRNCKPIMPTVERIIGKTKTLGRYLTDGFTRAGPKIKDFAEKYIPKAAEVVANLTEKAVDFATFIVDHWGTIGPIVKGVAAGFVGFKALNGISSVVGKVKTVVDVFKGLKEVTGITKKIRGLGAAFKGFSGIATFITNPFGQAVMVAVAFGTALVVIFKNWDKICAVCSKFFSFLGNAAKTIGSAFVGAFKMMADDVMALFKGIWDGFVNGGKSAVNWVIGGINSLIGKVNSIAPTVPDWVPLIGGKTFSLNIPEIPMLANGGIATAPTLAMVGEGSEDEAILPLSRLKAILERMVKPPPLPQNSGGGGQIIYQYSPVIQMQGNADAEKINQVLEEDKRRFERWTKEREEYDRRTRIKPKDKTKLPK